MSLTIAHPARIRPAVVSRRAVLPVQGGVDQAPLWGRPAARHALLPQTPAGWVVLRHRIEVAAEEGSWGRVRALLPHYGSGNSGIGHPAPTPAARAVTRHGGLDWPSRRVWSTQSVSLACRVSPEVITACATTGARVTQVCRLVGLYARGRDGRDAIIGQTTLAALMDCTVRTVQRALAAAQQLGLLACVFHGRHLTWIESAQAYANGSTQRRFTNVYDCTTPPDLAATIALAAMRHHRNVAPTEGLSSLQSSALALPLSRRCAARNDNAAARRHQQARARRAKSGVYRLATSLSLRVIWLRTVSRGRLCGLLKPFAEAPWPWSGAQLVDAMDRVCREHHVNAPARATGSPFGLLKWFLARIDPITDHPDAGRSFAVPEPRCLTCGRVRQVHDRYAVATGDPHRWEPDVRTTP